MKTLTQKWVNEELELEDVKEWINDNEGQIIGKVDKDHVAYLLYKLYLDDIKGRALGDFLQAVKKNDFMDVVARADSDSRKALPLFMLFIHNVAPSRYADGIKH